MRRVGVLALMLALVVGSLYMVAQQRADVTVTREQIASNPVNRFTVGHDFTGVAIVVHGFASNKEMMGSWGYTLARQGFDTYVIDQPGHGENSSRLPVGSSTALGDNLRAIIDQLVADGRAKPGRIALVGHSMGGSAVTMAALVDNRVGATVTLSSAYGKAIPVDKPVNLLSLVAQNDPANMVKAVQAVALQSNNGNGVVGQLYGSFALGTARESRMVTGRNHITILYDAETLGRTGKWIHASFGTQPPYGVFADQPWIWVLIALAGALGVLLSVGAMLAPRPSADSTTARMGLITALITMAVAAFSAVLASVYLRTPWIHLSLGDYMLPYFAVMAVVLFLLRVIWPNDFGFAWSAQKPVGTGLLKAAGIFLGYLGGFGVVLQMTVSHYVPTAPRLWPMALLAVCLWCYFVQEEAIKRVVTSSHGPWAGLFVGVVGKLLIVATWVGSSALPNPQPVLTLITPVILIFFVITEMLTFFLRRWRHSVITSATVVALILAWTMAVTFPLV